MHHWGKEVGGSGKGNSRTWRIWKSIQHCNNCLAPANSYESFERLAMVTFSCERLVLLHSMTWPLNRARAAASYHVTWPPRLVHCETYQPQHLSSIGMTYLIWRSRKKNHHTPTTDRVISRLCFNTNQPPSSVLIHILNWPNLMSSKMCSWLFLWQLPDLAKIKYHIYDGTSTYGPYW